MNRHSAAIGVTRITVLGIALTFASLPALSGNLTFPQTRAATYEETRQYQALGRVVTAPDGRFFLYEWSRPYNWAPDVDWLPAAAAKRMQTWLYKVDTDLSGTTSQYLFHPGSGASYYLGDLSPDGWKVTFYELDHDENALRAGVRDIFHEKLHWFDATPDSAHLNEPPVWLSNIEFAYRTKKGWVRAKLPPKAEEKPIGMPVDDTVKTAVCEDCETLIAKVRSHPHPSVPQSPSPAAEEKKREAKPGLPKDAKVLARSREGDLTVYTIDTNEKLALYFKKGSNEEPQVVFENERTTPPRQANTENATPKK